MKKFDLPMTWRTDEAAAPITARNNSLRASRIDAKTVEVGDADPVVKCSSFWCGRTVFGGEVVQASQLSEHDLLGNPVVLDRAIVRKMDVKARRRGIW